LYVVLNESLHFQGHNTPLLVGTYENVIVDIRKHFFLFIKKSYMSRTFDQNFVLIAPLCFERHYASYFAGFFMHILSCAHGRMIMFSCAFFFRLVGPIVLGAISRFTRAFYGQERVPIKSHFNFCAPCARRHMQNQPTCFCEQHNRQPRDQRFPHFQYGGTLCGAVV
jgi:hypothetical protein